MDGPLLRKAQNKQIEIPSLLTVFSSIPLNKLPWEVAQDLVVVVTKEAVQDLRVVADRHHWKSDLHQSFEFWINQWKVEAPYNLC